MFRNLNLMPTRKLRIAKYLPERLTLCVYRVFVLSENTHNVAEYRGYLFSLFQTFFIRVFAKTVAVRHHLYVYRLIFERPTIVRYAMLAETKRWRWHFSHDVQLSNVRIYLVGGLTKIRKKKIPNMF